MIVRTAGDKAEPFHGEGFSQGSGVFHDLVLVNLEIFVERFFQRHGFRGDDMHQRASLASRKHAAVKGLGKIVLAHDHAAAGTAQGLVGGGGDKLAIRDRRGVKAACHKAGHVGDVCHDHRSDLIGDLPESLEVNRPRIGACPHDNDFGFVLLRLGFHFIEIDGLRLPVHAVENHIVEPPGKVGRASVGEMAPVGEVHAEDRVAGLKHGEINGHVGLGARMGLNVHVIGSEKFLRPLDGQRLHDVHKLTAAIVALSGIPFRVLVGHDASLGLEDGFAHKILRGNEFQFSRLPLCLQQYGLGNLWIKCSQDRHVHNPPAY